MHYAYCIPDSPLHHHNPSPILRDRMSEVGAHRTIRVGDVWKQLKKLEDWMCVECWRVGNKMKSQCIILTNLGWLGFY